MIASVEWLPNSSAVIRVHPRGDHGTPYSWACVFSPDGEIANIKARLRDPTHEERVAMNKVLRTMGFSAVKWGNKIPKVELSA